MVFSIRLNKYLLKEHLYHPVAATRWHSGQKYLKFDIRIVNSNDPLESILILSYVSCIFSTKVLPVCSVFSFPVLPPAHHSHTHTHTHWIKLKIVRKLLAVLADVEVKVWRHEYLTSALNGDNTFVIIGLPRNM